MPPDNKSKKLYGLSSEFHQYNKLLKHLKKIHNDTFEAISDVIKTDSLSEGELISIKNTEELDINGHNFN